MERFLLDVLHRNRLGVWRVHTGRLVSEAHGNLKMHRTDIKSAAAQPAAVAIDDSVRDHGGSRVEAVWVRQRPRN
jgi:hypothetical protein